MQPAEFADDQRTEKHFVKMGEVIEDFRDRFGELMKVGPTDHTPEPLSLHPSRM